MSPVLSLLAAISSAPPVSALAAQLRDIHPGPMLVQAPDPRLQGWWALLIMLLMGALIGCMDVAMNANAVEVERRLGRAIMSSSHGFWSLGGFVGGSAGSYVIGYQICEKLNPTNCATATVTVVVETAIHPLSSMVSV